MYIYQTEVYIKGFIHLKIAKIRLSNWCKTCC